MKNFTRPGFILLPGLFLTLLFSFVSCHNRNGLPNPIFTQEEVRNYIPKGPSKCFRQISFDANEKRVYPDSVFKTQFSKQDPVKYAEFCKKINLDAVILQAVPQAGYATYLQTQVNTPYPGMKGDFFGETLRELHKQGISGFGYIGIGWIMKYAHEHPEYTNGDAGHPLICVNSPYRDKIRESSRELLRSYPIDGLRYDILDQPVECRCDSCRKYYFELFHQPMPAVWIDWQHQEKFRIWSLSRLVKDLYTTCKAVKPSVPVWQNWYNGEDRADISDVQSVDMAYLEFADPFRELFLNGVFDKDGIITGKVIENPLAAWKCLALGGRCYSYFASVGKTGLPDEDTLFERIVPSDWFEKNLAPFYARVREVQPYLEHSRPVTDLAIVYNEKTRYHYDQYNRDDYMQILRGITEPLLGAGNPIRFLSSEHLSDSSLAPYKALLLPESASFSNNQLAAIKRYAEEGGILVLSGDALSYSAGGTPLSDFALSGIMGVSRLQKAPALKKNGAIRIDSLEEIETGRILRLGQQPEKRYLSDKQPVALRLQAGQVLSLVSMPGKSGQPLVHYNPCGKGGVYYIASSEMPEVLAAVLNQAGIVSPVKNLDPSTLAVLTKKTDRPQWCLHLLGKGNYSLRIDRKYCAARQWVDRYPADLSAPVIKFTKDAILVEVSDSKDYAALIFE